MTRRDKVRRQGRRAVGACFAVFALTQLALSVVAESAHPDWRDPAFGARLLRLRERRRERAGRPLVLALGSSRVENGFRPDALGLPDDGPWAFNFGQPGAGPLLQWLTFQRLRAAGIRPDRLLIEMAPALLAESRTLADSVHAERLGVAELIALAPGPSAATALGPRWLESRLAPIHAWRFVLMSRLAPTFLPWSNRLDYLWDGLDAFGAVALPPEIAEPEAHARGVRRAAAEYRDLLAHFAIAPEADRALRRLLDDCRRSRTPVLLVLMPEAGLFRAWYPPPALAAIDDYLADLRREFGVPVLDARTWIADPDFYDGHHLLPAGAAAFSRRLGREARAFLLSGVAPAGLVR
jgi:hypothetical protein